MIMCVILCMIKLNALSNTFASMSFKQIGTYISLNSSYP